MLIGEKSVSQRWDIEQIFLSVCGFSFKTFWRFAVIGLQKNLPSSVCKIFLPSDWECCADKTQFRMSGHVLSNNSVLTLQNYSSSGSGAFSSSVNSDSVFPWCILFFYLHSVNQLKDYSHVETENGIKA